MKNCIQVGFLNQLCRVICFLEASCSLFCALIPFFILPKSEPANKSGTSTSCPQQTLVGFGSEPNVTQRDWYICSAVPSKNLPQPAMNCKRMQGQKLQDIDKDNSIFMVETKKLSRLDHKQLERKIVLQLRYCHKN